MDRFSTEHTDTRPCGEDHRCDNSKHSPALEQSASTGDEKVPSAFNLNFGDFARRLAARRLHNHTCRPDLSCLMSNGGILPLYNQALVMELIPHYTKATLLIVCLPYILVSIENHGTHELHRSYLSATR